jgi:hypothetical protein
MALNKNLTTLGVLIVAGAAAFAVNHTIGVVRHEGRVREQKERLLAAFKIIDAERKRIGSWPTEDWTWKNVPLKLRKSPCNVSRRTFSVVYWGSVISEEKAPVLSTVACTVTDDFSNPDQSFRGLAIDSAGKLLDFTARGSFDDACWWTRPECQL